MRESEPDSATWWAKGLLCENCNCQIVCPGHVHFEQLCTHETCVGYWAIRFDEGRFGDADLAGARALIAYKSPQHMIEGNWIQAMVIDETASAAQRQAVESILSGEAGGPWAKLARFVGRRLPTTYRPIRIDDEERNKRVSIAGLIRSTVEAIRGRDRDRPVTFDNMFNQIHSPHQVIARGSTSYDDGEITVETTGTHGLYSSFSWSGSPAA